MIEALEQNMSNFAEVIHREFGDDFSITPGAGAAGGLGFGLMAFCNAEIRSGFELISEITGLEKQISQADLVFTGEGKIDSQTAFGKTICGVAQLGKKYNVPVIALTGILSGNLEPLYNNGLTSAFAIANRPMTIGESKANAAELLTLTSEQVVRMMLRLH
jgi:glycerate kinase